jgi:hypothetical protein
VNVSQRLVALVAGEGFEDAATPLRILTPALSSRS